MLSLSTVQSTLAAQIAASTYFTTAPAVPVVVDDGYKERDIEAALRTVGFCVVVPPLLAVDFKDQGISKTFTGDAKLFVKVVANQRVNTATGGAGRNVAEAIKQVIAAVLNWTPTNGDRRFVLDPQNTVTLSMLDEGLVAYDVAFQKQISIN